MRKILTLATSLALCSVLTYVFINYETAQVEAEEEEHHHGEFVKFSPEQCKTHCITTEQASAGNLQKVVRAPAQITINSDQIAHIIPKVSGIAQKAYKNLGETVRSGEVIAILESKEMAEIKAAYLTALKKEQLASNAFEREKNLFDKSITSTQDYQQASNAKDQAAIELELTRQKLYALGFTISELDSLPLDPPTQLLTYELRSPIDGQIISRHFTPGEYVMTDHETFVVANLNHLWAEISIFPSDRQYVKKDQSVTIISNDGRSIDAKITYLSPVINENTMTSSVIAELDNSSGDWFPGSFAQAELMTEKLPVECLIPKTAVQDIDGSKVVFITDNDGFKMSPITTGRDDEEHYEILNGLENGETYAATNTFMLKAELQKEEAEHMD